MFVPDALSIAFHFLLLLIAKTQTMLVGFCWCCSGWGFGSFGGMVLFGFWKVWGFLLFCCFGFFFKIPYCFLKVHCFQLLIPHWLQNYYHLFMTISTATNIISERCDFKWKINIINSCKCHLLQTKKRDKETEIVTCETEMSKQNTCQSLFIKYYCVLLTTNMSVQHRKLPAEHDALNTPKSDCVADVKCKIH